MAKKQKSEWLILVDKNDRALGKVERMAAHRGRGKRHRAFLAMIFNKKGQLLLARRAYTKSLFPGYWDGSVASHPRFGERGYGTSLYREVREEVGMGKVRFTRAGEFTYQAKDEDRGSENELCALFLGITDEKVVTDPEEVAEIRWAYLKDLKKEIRKNRDKYAPWLIKALGVLGKNKLFSS